MVVIFDGAIEKEYFEWIYNMMCARIYGQKISYKKLFMKLYFTEFTYTIPQDENRREDGLSLRYRYSYEQIGTPNLISYINRPCSVLEMMVALAIRCEEDIMDDPAYGDRTEQWFGGMLKSLGISLMDDDRYDDEKVDYILNRFLNRAYSPDGKGGLFTLKRPWVDMRTVDIWGQLCYFLDEKLMI